jgi:hypothetical protein
MMHNFTPITGTGKKSEAIRQLQKAVRKITPRSSTGTRVNITTRGANISATGGDSSGSGSQVVSRWL